jgi:hypothetical protein
MKTGIKLTGLVLIIAIYVLFIASIAYGEPLGQFVISSNSSSTRSYPVNSRADAGGNIVTLIVNATMQHTGWKAYVGNISGGFTLDDANNDTIYAWSLSSYTGELYASTASSITWGSIACATIGAIESESNNLSLNSTGVDSINRTFSTQVHETVTVATTTILNSTCYSTALYINDTAQTPSETVNFQEIVLWDTATLVYAAPLEQNIAGYNNNSFDFQLLIPDNESTTVTTTYYFYVELDT